MKAILLSILLCFFGSQCALPVERQIDVEQSTLTIHVGKSGLLSAAGHEHTVTAPIANGMIDDGARAARDGCGTKSGIFDSDSDGKFSNRKEHGCRTRI